MNEKFYIQNIIETREIPKDLSIGRLILLLSKYYYSPDMAPDHFVKTVQDEIHIFDLDIVQYQDYKWERKIGSYYRQFSEGTVDCTLREIDYIPLFDSEIAKIESCETDREKKLLCTMYVMARFHNMDGWVNTDYSSLFKAANISVTTNEKIKLIRKLVSYGVVTMSKKIDNLNLHVDLEQDTSSPEALKISTLSNIGSQYLVATKPGYKLCERCSKLVKIKGPNTKYCSKCGIAVETDNNIRRIKKHRETVK